MAKAVFISATGEGASLGGGNGPIIGDIDTSIGAIDLGSSGDTGDGNASLGSGKRRGRPRKSPVDGGSSPDRTSGSGTTRRKAKGNHNDSVKSLQGTLLVFHLGVAGAFKAPELALTEGEAGYLADPLAKVLSDYDFEPDPKVMNVIHLIMAAGAIYGPRFTAINERKKANKAKDITPKQKVQSPLETATATPIQPQSPTPQKPVISEVDQAMFIAAQNALADE